MLPDWNALNALKGLLFFCHHAHVQLHLVSGMLGVNPLPIERPLFVWVTCPQHGHRCPAAKTERPVHLMRCTHPLTYLFSAPAVFGTLAQLHGARLFLVALEIGLDCNAPSYWGFCGIDLPYIMSTNFTCLGWWLGVKVVSLASMSSNDSLFTMAATAGEFKATAVPQFVFTVPTIRLKILSLIMSNWNWVRWHCPQFPSRTFGTG